MKTILKIGVKKQFNKDCQKYLAENGIIATPKLITKGSLKNRIRIYQKSKETIDGSNLTIWSKEIANKMNKLGFNNFDGKPLDEFSGNGGRFQIFASL